MTDTTDRPIALVTGASRGIGHAAALALAKAGFHVVAVARTQGGLEELDDAVRAAGGTATLVPMSLTDFEGIDRLGASLHERYGRLDALFGNAGILGPLSPVGHITPKSFDEVMAINLTANWRLLRSLDPLLRQAAHPRALFATSSVAHKDRPYWGAYATSKAALETLVRTYAAETKTFGIVANVINPGATRTKMRAQAMPGEDPTTLPAPEAIAPHILRLLSPETTETGAIFDVPTLSFQRASLPAPV